MAELTTANITLDAHMLQTVRMALSNLQMAAAAVDLAINAQVAEQHAALNPPPPATKPIGKLNGHEQPKPPAV
jgi:hypothetical protein